MKNNNVYYGVNQAKTNPKNYGDIEYRMSRSYADTLLKSRKGEDRNLSEQEFLCKYINSECDVKGNCVLVTTTL